MNTARSYNVAYGVVALIFMALALRFFALQVMWGSYYRQRSESNFIQEQRIPHSRGHIFDAKDQLLVDNRPSYDVYMTFALLPKGLPILKKLLAPLRWPKQRLQEAYQRIQDTAGQGSHEPIVLVKGLSSAVCSALQDRILSQGIRGVLVREGELHVHPLQFPNEQAVWTQLQNFLELSQQQLDNLMQAAKRRAGGFARFKPSLLIADVSFEAQARIQSAIALGTLAGVSVVNAHKRRYIHGDLASHTLGFVNEVSLQEVRDSEGAYFVGHKVGRQGIEKSYEDVLRGGDGIRRIVVDARGRRLEESRQKSIVGGCSCCETPSCRSGFKVVSGCLFTALCTEDVCRSGRCSRCVRSQHRLCGWHWQVFPAITLTMWWGRNNGAILHKLTTDPLKPWINRCIQSHYPPASLFKPVVALSALGQGIVTPHDKQWCGGQFTLARTTWGCVKRQAHGWVDLHTALRSSCDVYFYRLGKALGTDLLAKGARQLGFGNLVGIDLPSEATGFIPTCDYYRRRKGYCAPGFAINSAIGQGDVTVTALQLAVAYAALANGGIVYRPQIVRTVSQAGIVQKEYAPQAAAYIDAKPEDLTVIRQALSAVMQRGGTAYGLRWNSDWPQLAQWLRKSTLSIGAKTGTGQVVRLGSQRVAVEDTPYLQRDHAWFVGFAPSHRPEVVVVVLVEHGGWGSKAAAPIGCDVIRAWSQGRGEQDAG